MFNFLGKTLVLLNVAVSMLFLGVAVMLYTSSPDLGGTQPKEEIAGTVASELDKRIAAVKQAVEWKYQAYAELQKAKARLRKVQTDRASNYLWYVGKIYELDSSPAKTILIQKVKTLPTLDNKGRFYETDDRGRPVLEAKAVTYSIPAGPTRTLDKSYAQYFKRFIELREERERHTDEYGEWIARQKFITEQRKRVPDPNNLNGPPLSPGILDLIQSEIQNQERLRAEKRSIESLWVREIRSAQQLKDRQLSLMARVKELEDAVKRKNGKK